MHLITFFYIKYFFLNYLLEAFAGRTKVGCGTNAAPGPQFAHPYCQNTILIKYHFHEHLETSVFDGSFRKLRQTMQKNHACEEK